MKKAPPVLSIVLYVIAGLLALYTIWALSVCYGDIKQYMQEGLTFAGNEYLVVRYYTSECLQYAIFAVILSVLGWMLQKKSSIPLVTDTKDMEDEKPASDDKESKDEDESFDKWFNSEN